MTTIHYSVPDRIVSVKSTVHPTNRTRKAGKPVEFGAKLDISVSNGWARLDYWSFDAHNEATKLVETIERYRAREGTLSGARAGGQRFTETAKTSATTKLHRNPAQRSGIGKTEKDEQRDRRQTHFDQNERIEVERQFQLCKTQMQP